jgi:hypothetical protein
MCVIRHCVAVVTGEESILRPLLGRNVESFGSKCPGKHSANSYGRGEFALTLVFDIPNNDPYTSATVMVGVMVMPQSDVLKGQIKFQFLL